MATQDQPPLVVNGRSYPLWSQFVHRQKEWIGGTLQDLDERGQPATKIEGIELTPNGKESAFFGVTGAGFSCGFDVTVGGVVPGEDGWITFSGYGNHKWRIKQPSKGE
jgi:hypothetical protein